MRKMMIAVCGVVATAMVGFGFLGTHHAEAQGKPQLPGRTVEIVNSEANPVPVTGTIRDAENPGRQPFSVNLSIAGPGSSSFPVPANKRLVITHVNAFCQTPTVPDTIAIQGTANGVLSELLVPFSITTGPTATNRYAVQQVMGFADPGTSVTVTFFVFGGSTGNARVNIHGYFVDVPQP
jgi:hypothetical protein